MRILQLTPGTGTFLCGSCLRDNDLVKRLAALGHDTLIAPLYLPFALEGEASPEVHGQAVHMGGINVYLQQVLPWLRWLPRFLHDRLDSPRLLRWAAGRSKMTEAPGLGALTLSMLRGEEGRQHSELARLVGWLRELPRPDVVILSNAMLVGLAREIRAALGCPVLCTLQGEAPFLDALDEPFAAQCWEALAERAQEIDAFLPVSHYTAKLMGERMGIEPERLHVVWNGIDGSAFEPRAESAAGPPTIGYLARMCRDKGIDRLFEAYLWVQERLPEVRLVAAGVVLPEDRALLEELRRRARAAGLEDRVELRGPISRDEKHELLPTLDVFSVPAMYGESFGLYLLEAWASGVPVVQPDHGAFPELLANTEGGLLCANVEPDVLGAALLSLLEDGGRARSMGAAGRRSVLERFDGVNMARAVEQVCRLTAQNRTPTSRPSLDDS